MTERSRSGPILSTLTTLLLLGAACQPAASAPPTIGALQPTAATVQPTAAAAKPTTGQPAPTSGSAAQPTTAPATQPAVKGGGQVVYAGVGSDVRILNPILQSDTVSGAITERLFEPLVQEDPKTGALIPALAESWK